MQSGICAFFRDVLLLASLDTPLARGQEQRWMEKKAMCGQNATARRKQDDDPHHSGNVTCSVMVISSHVLPGSLAVCYFVASWADLALDPTAFSSRDGLVRYDRSLNRAEDCSLLAMH